MAAAVSAQGPRPSCPGFETHWRQWGFHTPDFSLNHIPVLFHPSAAILTRELAGRVCWPQALISRVPRCSKVLYVQLWFCFEEIRHVRLSGCCLRSQEEEAS